LLRPEEMHQVSVIVAKDQLPNFLSFAGREQIIHLVTVEDEQLPPGAAPFEATGLLAKSAIIRNRISVLIASLQPIKSKPEKIEVRIHDIDELALFLDQETSRLEASVRELEESQGKLLADKERTSELSRFLSGLETIGMPLGAIGGSGFLVTLAGECPRESTVSVQADLDQITYGNLIFVITHSSEKTQTFLAIFPNAFEDDAKQAAAALGARVEEPWTDLPEDPREAVATAKFLRVRDPLDPEGEPLRQAIVIDEETEEECFDGIKRAEYQLAQLDRAVVLRLSRIGRERALKVTDAEMRALNQRYPGYGFDQHKGYATPEHLDALGRAGPCEIHRRSFYPIGVFYERDLFSESWADLSEAQRLRRYRVLMLRHARRQQRD